MGLASGHFITSRGTADVRDFLNGEATVRYLAAAAQTLGTVSLALWSIPSGSGSNYHLHPGENEAFFVLAGELGGVLDGEAIHAGPGSLVWIPRGTPHMIRSVGTEAMETLVVFTPGDTFDTSFRLMSRPVGDDREPIGEMPDFAALGERTSGMGIPVLLPPKFEERW
ncbi:MAG: cupin domain-containing protein [Thermomicrobiales bacterium]